MAKLIMETIATTDISMLENLSIRFGGWRWFFMVATVTTLLSIDH